MKKQKTEKNREPVCLRVHLHPACEGLLDLCIRLVFSGWLMIFGPEGVLRSLPVCAGFTGSLWRRAGWRSERLITGAAVSSSLCCLFTDPD